MKKWVIWIVVITVLAFNAVAGEVHVTRTLAPDTFHKYSVTSSTGNESKMYNTVINDKTVCISKALNASNQLYECECTKTNQLTGKCDSQKCGWTTYNYPSIVNVYNKKSQLLLSIPSIFGWHCIYLDDPSLNNWLRFGENSIIIEAETHYNTTDNNVTQEVQFAHMSLNDSAISLYMPFEINQTSTIYDYSNYSNDGSISGITAPIFNSSGFIGGAYQFDGTNDVITIQENESMDLLAQGTIAAWIKVESSAEFRTVLAKGETTISDDEYLLFIRSDVPELYLATLTGGFKDDQIVGDALTIGKWVHILGTWNNTHAMFYQNGTLKNTVARTFNLTATNNPVTIGTSQGGAHPFSGLIDEVMILNRSMSFDEVTDVYNNQSNRFFSEGTMTFNTSFDLGTNNTVNLTLDNCTIPVGTTLNASFNNGPEVTFDSSCRAVNILTAGSELEDNLTIHFYSDSFGFYSPLIIGNITLDGFALVNSPPTITSVILNSTLGTNTTSENLTSYPINVSDVDGDRIKNITDWRLNSNSIAVLNMPFENHSSASTNVTDYSTLENNGTVIGATFNGTGGHDNKGAYSFDGSNDLIDAGTDINITKEITVSVWVKPNVLDNFQVIASKADYTGEGDNAGWEMTIGDIGGRFNEFDFAIGNDNWDFAVSDDNVVTVGDWQHLVATWNASATDAPRLYRNAVELTPKLTAIGISEMALTSNPVRIGWDDIAARNYFNGVMDELIIYNRTLSPEQIKALYENRTDLIVSQETNQGETWQACVTPNDGIEDGAEVCSNTLTVDSVGAPADTIVGCKHFKIGNRSNELSLFQVDCNGDVRPYSSYLSSDGTKGTTNSSGFWFCSNTNCSSICKTTVKDGLVTGSNDCLSGISGINKTAEDNWINISGDNASAGSLFDWNWSIFTNILKLGSDLTPKENDTYVLGNSTNRWKEVYATDINANGNITGNIVYGEMWFHNDSSTGVTTVISAQGEWANLTGFNQSDDSDQTLNGFEFNTEEETLSARVAGKYKVDFSISFGNSGNNQEYQLNIFVNNVEQENTDVHRKIGAAGDVGNAGSSGFIDLSVGDNVSLKVKNNDGTDDVYTHTSNVNLFRVGD